MICSPDSILSQSPPDSSLAATASPAAAWRRRFSPCRPPPRRLAGGLRACRPRVAALFRASVGKQSIETDAAVSVIPQDRTVASGVHKATCAACDQKVSVPKRCVLSGHRTYVGKMELISFRIHYESNVPE